MNLDNNNIRDIGLVLWGCKGGYRIFCSSGVDVNTKDISDTLKDIRSFVSIRRHGIDYYAVEFTQRYKVYTHYRSSNDSGAGAFIAITVFVPHTLMITNIREVLDEMVTRYFREYVNPLNGTPLPGKFDEIRPFQTILESMARIVADKRMFSFSPSVQNDFPRILRYDDPAQLDKYFENPYHKEFYDCQEVMFFRKDVYDNRAQYDITFNREPEVITTLTESVPMNRLAPFAADGITLASLTVNGADILHAMGETGLADDDRLEMTFTAPHFEPMTVTGAVKDLLKTSLTRRGHDYHIVAPRLRPKRYYLTLEAEGCPVELLAAHLKLASKIAGVVTATKEGPGYMMIFDGPKVAADYSVIICPDDRTQFTVASCNPLQLIGEGRSLVVKARVVRPDIIVPEGEKPEIYADVTCDGLTLKVAVTPGRAFVVPALAEVYLRSNDGTITKTDRGYQFNPYKATYRVNFPAEFNRLTGGYGFKVTCAGKDYSIDGALVRLPIDDVNAGGLLLKCSKGNNFFNLPLTATGKELEIGGTVVANRTTHPLDLDVDGAAEKVAPLSLKVFLTRARVELANPNDATDTAAKMEETGSLRIYVFSDKGAPAVVNDKTSVKASDKKGGGVAVATTAGKAQNEAKPVKRRRTFVDIVVDALDALWTHAGKISLVVLVLALIGGAVWWWGFRTTEYTCVVKYEPAGKIRSINVLDTDTISGQPRISGATMTFVISEPQKEVTGKERIIIDFGAEGCDTLSLDKAWDKQVLVELNSYLKLRDKEKSVEKIVKLTSTPAERAYMQARDNVTDEVVAQYKAQYPATAYADSLAVLLGKKKADEAAAAEQAAAAEAARKAVVDGYNKLLAKLSSIDCTVADVANIRAYEAEHKDEIGAEISKNAAKVQAYADFFDVKQAPSKGRAHFTPQQRQALQYYNTYFDANKKNDSNRNFRYALDKMGAL